MTRASLQATQAHSAAPYNMILTNTSMAEESKRDLSNHGNLVCTEVDKSGSHIVGVEDDKPSMHVVGSADVGQERMLPGKG